MSSSLGRFLAQTMLESFGESTHFECVDDYHFHFDEDLWMKRWIGGLLLSALTLSVSAGQDETARAEGAALEQERARAAAGDRARQETRARQRQQMEAGSTSAMASDYRRYLGAQAEGKSDDEVIRLYHEKQAAGAVR